MIDNLSSAKIWSISKITAQFLVWSEGWTVKCGSPLHFYFSNKCSVVPGGATIHHYHLSINKEFQANSVIDLQACLMNHSLSLIFIWTLLKIMIIPGVCSTWKCPCNHLLVFLLCMTEAYGQTHLWSIHHVVQNCQYAFLNAYKTVTG